MKRDAYCDLHTHTLYSDGTLSPSQLLELARENGVRVLALTDHDTLAGFAEATEAGRRLGIEVICGIELSVLHEGRDLHLLGYFLHQAVKLQDILRELESSRFRRAQRMVARLQELGCDIDFGAVQKRSQGRVIGRPHVAEELVARGHVPDIETAFERWIGDGAPAYIPKRTLGLAEGATRLRKAGGVASLAHPHVYRLDEALIAALPRLGVAGLEVWHPSHDSATADRYLEWAVRYDLVATGGSDFHRPTPGGIVPGDLGVTASQLERLRARLPAPGSGPHAYT